MADPVLGPVAVNDKFKVTINQRLYGQRVMNVLWYYIVTDPPPAVDRWQAQIALANQLNAANGVIPTMLQMQTEDLTMQSVRVQSFRGIAERLPYSEIVVTDPGVIVTPAGDANTALSIEKRAIASPTAPRQGIGRMQVAGIPQGNYSGGVFTAGYMVLAQALADELTESITALGITWNPCLVTWGPATISAHDLFGAIAKDTVRVMRRRTVGVGE